MSDHQQQTVFLRHLLLCADTSECQQMEERIQEAQCQERCVRRAVCLMALFTALAIIGLGYAAVFQEEFSPETSQLIIKMLGALGLGSLISLLAFLALWLIYRHELNGRREESRQLTSKVMEARLGKASAL